MGFIRKLLGIPETKHIYTKDVIVDALRNVLPTNRLEYYDNFIIAEFREIAEPLCNYIIQGLHQARLPKNEIDRVGHHQIMEHFIVAYATNAFLAGWGSQYEKQKFDTNQVIDQTEPILNDLEYRLVEEVNRVFQDKKITAVFSGAFHIAFQAGMENASSYLSAER